MKTETIDFYCQFLLNFVDVIFARIRIEEFRLNDSHSYLYEIYKAYHQFLQNNLIKRSRVKKLWKNFDKKLMVKFIKNLLESLSKIIIRRNGVFRQMALREGASPGFAEVMWLQYLLN